MVAAFILSVKPIISPWCAAIMLNGPFIEDCRRTSACSVTNVFEWDSYRLLLPTVAGKNLRYNWEGKNPVFAGVDPGCTLELLYQSALYSYNWTSQGSDGYTIAWEFTVVYNCPILVCWHGMKPPPPPAGSVSRKSTVTDPHVPLIII